MSYTNEPIVLQLKKKKLKLQLRSLLHPSLKKAPTTVTTTITKNSLIQTIKLFGFIIRIMKCVTFFFQRK